MWSLCSQGPHDKTVVARCAQWRPQPTTSLKLVKEMEILLNTRDEGIHG